MATQTQIEMLRELRSWPMRVAEKANYADMIGESGTPIYDDAIAELDYVRSYLIELRNHIHNYDSNGFCYDCGADGNA